MARSLRVAITRPVLPFVSRVQSSWKGHPTGNAARSRPLIQEMGGKEVLGV